MTTLQFPAPPKVSLWTTFMKRGAWSGELPRIEAVADTMPTDAGAYARVCGFSAADPLPITWPGVATIGLQLAVMTAPAFPLPITGIVHTRQRITRHRHIRPGEALAARCVVEGHRVVRAGGEFDMCVTVTAGSDVVWEGVTTILSRTIRGHGGDREPSEAAPMRVARSTRWRIPADQGRRYAAVSGDYNPIHLSAWTARPFGFKRPIAHGWWTLARALAELDADVPEACTVDARFVAPVSLPDTVTFEAGPSDGGVRFEVRGRKVCIVGAVTPDGASPI
ncbi:MAG: MaoC/PaaZ C-terminal domain-containing protein [Pseudomonadota bacterium]|nr:MaoC/PaaZ C-terminal domain-containing protein [Pseudomonadota bacterium]